MKEQILKLRTQGLTYRKIKNELGCSLGCIAYHCGEGVKQRLLSNQKEKYIPHPSQKMEYTPEEIKVQAKGRMLKHRYNLSLEEYTELYNIQNKKCAICKNNLHLGTKNGLYVDHDHNTNEVRGLLCPNCNTGLGKFKDSETILQNAIDYLNK